MIHELVMLSKGDKPENDSDFSSASFEPFYITCATLQSLSITQQGFLNAIVYGWTRDDFLHIMAIGRGGTLSSLTGSQNTPQDDDDETWVIHSDEDGYDETVATEDEKISRQGSSKSAHSVTAHRLQMSSSTQGRLARLPPP